MPKYNLYLRNLYSPFSQNKVDITFTSREQVNDYLDHVVGFDEYLLITYVNDEPIIERDTIGQPVIEKDKPIMKTLTNNRK